MTAPAKMEGSAFLKVVVGVFPYKIHTVLTDNGMAFADLPKNREGPSRRFLGPHIFDRVCMANAIEHRLTQALPPVDQGQAERMNRTIKDATIKTYHFDDLENLKAHVMAFVTDRPTRVVGSRGADWRAWAGKVSALSQLRVGGAPQQPSEFTHTMRQEKPRAGAGNSKRFCCPKYEPA